MSSDNSNNNDNEDGDDFLFPSETTNPFSSSNEVLSKTMAKEIVKCFLSNPTEVAYIKTSSGDHIISRTAVFSENVLLLINPSVPQFVPETTLSIDENGQENIVKGLKAQFIRYAPLASGDAMVPLFFDSIDIITKASKYLTLEYSKVFPIEETILSEYAKEYKKDADKLKNKSEKDNETTSQEEESVCVVLDDGRIVHNNISKSIN